MIDKTPKWLKFEGISDIGICYIEPATMVALGSLAVTAVDKLTDRRTGYRVDGSKLLNQDDYNWKGPSQANYAKQGAKAQNRQAAQANYDQANLAKALSMESRQEQANATDLYRDAAMGNGPSAAQNQFASALDQSMRAQQSLAAGARGGGLAAAAASRRAMQQAGDMQAQATNQSAALRAQEMQGAMAGYSGAANSMRSQDAALMGQEAQMSQFNTEQKTKQAQLNDQMQTNYDKLGFDAASAQQQGAIAYNTQKSKNWAEEGKINAQIEMENQKNKGWFSSDENAKTNIKSGEKDIADFLNQLNASLNKKQSSVEDNMRLAEGIGSLINSFSNTDVKADRMKLALDDSMSGFKPQNTMSLASDEKAKTNVKSGNDEIDGFLDELKAHTYKYKNPSQDGSSPGQHTSVMAQELEKTKLGKRMVKNTSHGKMVNYGEGFATMLAAQASLNKRLNDIEKVLSKRSG